MNNKNIPNKILHWYDNNKRILPWRKKVSQKQKEYFTFVSEFMLQQTQVKTVIPYFEKFVKQIPTFQSLADVDEKILMKHWEGLGYYSRARNLKKSAIKILKDFNGKLPKSYEKLIQLPGVGEYTSKAIMSIAFNIKTIPLDGNVERILKRTLYLKKQNEISKDSLKTKINFFGLSDRASDYAQAIMEIGALICKPFKPVCTKCPIDSFCYALKTGQPEKYPVKKKLKSRPHFNVVIAIMWRKDKFYIQKK